MPRHWMLPEDFLTRPAMALSRVDLPAPLGPMRARRFPQEVLKLIFWRAIRLRYLTVRFSTAMS